MRKDFSSSLLSPPSPPCPRCCPRSLPAWPTARKPAWLLGFCQIGHRPAPPVPVSPVPCTRHARRFLPPMVRRKVFGPGSIRPCFLLVTHRRRFAARKEARHRRHQRPAERGLAAPVFVLRCVQALCGLALDGQYICPLAQLVQVVGPGLHHGLPLVKVLGAVVCPAQ